MNATTEIASVRNCGTHLECTGSERVKSLVDQNLRTTSRSHQGGAAHEDIRMSAWEPHRDEVGGAVEAADVVSCRGQGPHMRCGNNEEDSLKTSSWEVQGVRSHEPLGMREFVWNCGVDRTSPPVLL